MFQFHFGSIQTKPSRPIRSPRIFVSIPLWFDSNGTYCERRNLCKTVSIPLWFDSNKFCLRCCCEFYHVSIPLWFDSNLLLEAEEPYLDLFQFHFGSIQTCTSGVCCCERFVCFNSTLVRFKPDWQRNVVCCYTLFQFHFGSIQTTMRGRNLLPWCGSFNSTLVRFKHDTQTCYGIFSTLFQFHFGSIQTEPHTLWRLRLLCFNSTLVRFKHAFEQDGIGSIS